MYHTKKETAVQCMNKHILNSNFYNKPIPISHLAQKFLRPLRYFSKTMIVQAMRFTSKRALSFLRKHPPDKVIAASVGRDISKLCIDKLTNQREDLSKYVARYNKGDAMAHQYRRLHRELTDRFIPLPTSKHKRRKAQVAVQRIVTLTAKGAQDYLASLRARLREKLFAPAMRVVQDVLVTAFGAARSLLKPLLGILAQLGATAITPLEDVLNFAETFATGRVAAIGNELIELLFNRIDRVMTQIGAVAVSEAGGLGARASLAEQAALRTGEVQGDGPSSKRGKVFVNIFDGLFPSLTVFKPFLGEVIDVMRQAVPGFKKQLDECDDMFSIISANLQIAKPR